MPHSILLVGMDENQINIEIMQIISVEQIENLVSALKKIDGFTFFIDAQFKIRNQDNSRTN